MFCKTARRFFGERERPNFAILSESSRFCFASSSCSMRLRSSSVTIVPPKRDYHLNNSVSSPIKRCYLTVSLIQIYTPPVKKKLTPAVRMRLKLRAELKRKKAEEKEERLLARWLLFCKGSGKDKNLNQKDSLFVNQVVHKSYDRYMSDLIMGTKTRLTTGNPLKMTTLTPSRPPSFKSYRRTWYGGAKVNYIRHDVPRLVKMRMEMLRNGSSDTSLQELSGRYMQELQRQISERERGNMGVSVSIMPVYSGGQQGRDTGQKQLRERRKKTPAGNRDAATVGA